ncbi:hypothetical protein [Desulfosporosinus sp. BG]|uniref:hypothetical protein n=1 Tax=Desulfosporosinus sp. BG TaxID=1633135 RepID=UPI000839E242|nr:hypothetical protein [Desulfosporosinus sp. BG]ODA40159.1 hypothetical protein DSBG_3016 [Desulfosporosinus sp. BG]
MSLKEQIGNVKVEMESEVIQSENGLGQDLFMFASTLMSVVNVNLLVTNSKYEALLSWRDDPHCGSGRIFHVVVSDSKNLC